MSVTAKQVQNFTSQQIHRLIALPESSQKAALANLRRGIGQPPGALPELWGEFLLEMPEEMLSTNGEPSYAEWAVYTALTTFALHQQSSDPHTTPMNKSGQSLGRAVARLVSSEEDRPRVARRFNAFATATDPTGLAYHLRNLVQLLKAEGIPLDYPRLSADLFRFMCSPTQADQVRLVWGQDFYRNNTTDEE